VAALTFLQLVNRTRRECGLGGADLTTLQTGLVAEQTRFKDWVNDAWIDVQLMRSDWLWMRGTFSFSTVPGITEYTPADAGVTDLGDWVRRTFRCHTTSVGTADEQILPFMDYDTWRDVYQFANMRDTTGRPVVLSILPDRSLGVGPVPDLDYTVSGEYHRAPVSLSADADTPSGTTNPMPERYQMLVVYRAMQAYGVFSAAPELVDRGARQERRLLQQLAVYSTPTIIAGPPLA
jgi:hypothetical protein